MIKIFLLILITFILENNLYMLFNTYIFNYCLIIPLILILKNRIKNKKILYTTIIIISIIYDLIFSNRMGYLLLSNLIFLILINYLDFKLSIKELIISIFFYRLINFFILFLIGYINFDIVRLLKSIYGILIINILYFYIIKRYILKSS